MSDLSISCLATLMDVREWIEEHPEEELLGVCFFAVTDAGDGDTFNVDMLTSGNVGTLIDGFEHGIRRAAEIAGGR